MTDLDRRLLDAVQNRVPFVREPFAELAGRLGCDERTVIARIAALRGPGGVIREISGIFDAAALGYAQALVAFRVPPARIDQAGQTVAAHPGVSHCYERRGAYNLWFTLATAPGSVMGLAGTAEVLARRCGADRHMVLPSLRRYSIKKYSSSYSFSETHIRYTLPFSRFTSLILTSL